MAEILPYFEMGRGLFLEALEDGVDLVEGVIDFLLAFGSGDHDLKFEKFR